MCSAPLEEREGSDKRRRRVTRIRDETLARVHEADYLGAIRLQEESVRLVTDEKLAVHLGGTYEALARLHAAIANRRRSIHYTRLALSEMEAYGGPEGRESVMELQEMLEQMERVAGRS